MMRLDKYLVDQGLARTRSRAIASIREGFVTVDGEVVRKASAKVENAVVVVNDPNAKWVSRAAQKLLAIIDDVHGRHAIDLGASTGGFTQVLLERGAASVIAIDVGHDQLDSLIANDARVTVIEGMNVKDTTREQTGDFDVITADLSFIALRKALPAALALAQSGCDLYVLVKPQFELDKSAIGKNGLVKTPELAQSAVDAFSEWIDSQGWTIHKTKPSPIKGGDGNQEFLIHAGKR